MDIKNDELIEKNLETKVKEIQNKQSEELKQTKKKNKTIFTSVIAAIVGLSIVITGIVHVIKNGKNKDKNKDNNNDKTKPTTSIVLPEEEVSIDGIGLEEENPNMEPTEKPQYGNTTGDITKDNLVEKDDTIWKDDEAANNSSNIGNNGFDNQNGTLEQGPDGDIYENEDGYEVEDENGNTLDQGSNESGVPDGYVWDDVLGKYVKEADAGKYVHVDNTYYDENGEIVFEKGDIVTRETLEEIKKNFTTTRPIIVPEETQPESPTPEMQPEQEETQPESIVTEQGVINPNGTYTIYGVTYMSKADYEQFLLYPEQYGYYNGMVLSLEDIEALFNQNQKTK